MDDSIRYTASEFVQLVTSGDQNISEFMSIETDDDGKEKVVFRNMRGTYNNYHFSRGVSFTTLGMHKNFCVTFKCDMSEQRAMPSFGIGSGGIEHSSYNGLRCICATDISRYPGENNRAWVFAESLMSYVRDNENYSYNKRGSICSCTICKQGAKVWLWIDRELTAYHDLDTGAFQNEIFKNEQRYLYMGWDWSNMVLDWVKIYDIEISMNDYPIDVSFDYNIFTPVGNLLTIDASKCTQQEGEIVSADWDGVADTLIHKEYIENDKIIKCDLFGSKGGHFTYYLHCFVGNGIDKKQELLNDVYYDLKLNWQQYDPNVNYPSETAFCAGLYSDKILTFTGQANANALNFSQTVKNGLFEIGREANPNANNHFTYNYVKNYKNFNKQATVGNRGAMDDYPVECIGIGIYFWSDYARIVIGHNLLLDDGTDFENNQNLDVWKNRYGEDLFTDGTTPKIVHQFFYPSRPTKEKVKLVRHKDYLLVYFNNKLAMEIKSPLFSDISSLHPSIYQYGYLRDVSEYITSVYHETVGAVITEEEGGLSELLASSTSSPVIALMIESEALSEPICLYKGFKEVYLQDATETIRLFTPTGMTVQLPERKSGGGDALSFGLGDVSGQVLFICEQIRGSAKPAYVTLLQYLPFDEISNDDSNAPAPVYNLNLFVTGVAITTEGATISAGWHDTLNAKFPFKRYTAKEFPGLKYVTK